MNNPKLKADFFKTNNDNEPVREWLKTLTKEDKRQIGLDIQTVQFGWPLGMPLVENLGNGLWEIRTKLKSNRIVRIIFFMNDSTMILANGFIKKTEKTPNNEIKLALERKNIYERAISSKKKNIIK